MSVACCKTELVFFLWRLSIPYRRKCTFGACMIDMSLLSIHNKIIEKPIVFGELP